MRTGRDTSLEKSIDTNGICLQKRKQGFAIVNFGEMADKMGVRQ
jgi:hypothetical protein